MDKLPTREQVDEFLAKLNGVLIDKGFDVTGLNNVSISVYKSHHRIICGGFYKTEYVNTVGDTLEELHVKLLRAFEEASPVSELRTKAEKLGFELVKKGGEA